jgi:hypothetical protein
MLRMLGPYYPIAPTSARPAKVRGLHHLQLFWQPGAPAGSVTVTADGDRATIAYDRPCHALRGLGALLSGLVDPGRSYREKLPFDTFGIMLDCSRNAVMTVTHFQQWLRQLALLGYNMAMLYTEDTYQLAGEPSFGYLRGRYSADELAAIDRYAAGLGIEMIGCIQTLGHLEQILKWPAYSEVGDTASVVLADHQDTYRLIDKMIGNYARCFRARRIHVGMDETHDLGRGRFLDRFGYRPPVEVFNAHLARVVAICRKHGLTPLIWSDMYFRLGSKKHDYYDTKVAFPASVRAAIPGPAQLVYWDYYHEDQSFYEGHIRRHRALGKEPLMASGVWTWGVPWHDFDHTRRTVTPCLAACRKQGVKEFFVTLWGDDGGYCEFDSALTGLAYTAEVAYGGGLDADQRLAQRFGAICGGDYQQALRFDLPSFEDASALLWDDPLLGIFYKARCSKDRRYGTKLLTIYRRVLKRFGPAQKTNEPIDFAHGAALLRCLSAKLALAIDLHHAYARRNKAGLAGVRWQVPAVIRAIDDLLASFRRQWMKRNKPQGLEVIQVRLGSLKQRYLELDQRLGELSTGKIPGIPELEETAGPAYRGWQWRHLASASSIL